MEVIMPKQAVLVTFTVQTRVVVDIPEGSDLYEDSNFGQISKAAIENVRNNTMESPNYPYAENIAIIEMADEVPFNKENDEEEE